MSLLGIDVGTTGCKAVAFNEKGQILSSAYREYPLNSPQPGWAELDGNRVWADVKACIGKVASETKQDPITALAVSCQGEAVSYIDERGEIIHNALVSFDNRTESYVQPWEEKFGRTHIFEVTGQPLAALYTALKLQWMHENRPEVMKRTKHLLGFEDLVMYRLGMEPTTDYTLAARTLLFDVPNKAWRGEFLDFAGIDPALMPALKPSGTLMGTVPDAIAAVDAPPLADCLDTYWGTPAVWDAVTLRIAGPPVEMALLKRLGLPDFVDATAFRAQMERVYSGVTEHALEIAFGETDRESTE